MFLHEGLNQNECRVQPVQCHVYQAKSKAAVLHNSEFTCLVSIVLIIIFNIFSNVQLY